MMSELKAKWIKTLRSGEYKQGTGKLKDETLNTFCCLGVLCEVAGLKSGINTCGSVYYDYEGDSESIKLPSNFCEEMEISNDLQSELISMNDTDKNSFAEIADYIEDNV